jgi:hypothetical protein
LEQTVMSPSINMAVILNCILFSFKRQLVTLTMAEIGKLCIRYI